MTENQINEMFRLMNTAIQKIDGLENRVGGLEGRMENLETEVKTLRSETQQGFKEVKEELRFLNRRTEVLIDDSMDTRTRVRDLEVRVWDLERKDAA